MEALDLNQALVSCLYYPVHVDLGRRLVWFAEIDRDSYRRSAFLAPRQMRISEKRYGFNLDDVLLHDLSLPIGGAPSHYIFISAFCCSTLLARMFDQVPACLVLREPSILGQLAMLRFRPGTAESTTTREESWRTWGALGVRLLTRTFDPGQTVIVKAADVCNTMADVILANDSRSKAVLLSVDLRTFILSVLKLENRKEWTRKRADFWCKTMTMFPALNAVNVLELDDAHKAAYIWLVTAGLWDWLQKQTDGRRLLLMDGEEVTEDPGNVLRQLATFFGLPLKEKRVSQILASPLLTRHAKFPGQTYGVAERRNDRADWERRFGDEADKAMAWAASIQQKLEADGVGLGAMAGTKLQETVQ